MVIMAVIDRKLEMGFSHQETKISRCSWEYFSECSVLVAGEPLSSRQLCVLLNMENQDYEVQKVLCGVMKKGNLSELKILIEIIQDFIDCSSRVGWALHPAS